MPNCAISTCKNYSRVTKDTAIRYFRFPAEENFAKQWVITCCRKDKINVKNARICSIHFAPDCFEIPLRQRLLNYSTTNSRVIKNDAVPTLNLPKKSSVQEQPSSRSLRMAKKQQTEEVNQIIASSATLEYTGNYSEPIVNTNEIEMQMDFDDINKIQCLQGRILELESEVLKINGEKNEMQQKILKLENENRELLKKVEEFNNSAEETKTGLETIFTKGQIKKLLNPKITKIRWSPEDIASAISLRSVSPKAYRYLRANGHPLPALSTLRTWASTFNLNQGVLHSVCTLLKGKIASMNILDRLCVSSFDEMYVSNRIDIEKKKTRKNWASQILPNCYGSRNT